MGRTPLVLACLVFASFLPAAAGAQCPSYLATWGSSGSGDGQFNVAAAIATDAAGNVYVADRDNDRIQKFSASGVYLSQWGAAGSGPGQFASPSGIAIDGSGRIYVADTDNHRVQRFSAAGVYETEWGSMGAGDGQLNGPRGIAVGPTGEVYVVDSGNHRVQKFTDSGTFLTKWGSFGTASGQFRSPNGVATNASGEVYVVDTGNSRVQKFSSSGTYLAQWGSFGTGPGNFDAPAGIAIDAGGNIYIADSNNNRIQLFDALGVFTCAWGQPGNGVGQFFNPLGVAVYPGGLAYIADSFNHRVQKFGPRTVSGGINLAWDNCGSAGALCKSFACDANTGPRFPLIGSFKVDGISNFLGFSAELTIQSSSATLPDWWRHGTGQCQGNTNLSVSADFTGGPFTCADATIGAASGGFSYTVGPEIDRAHVSIQFAIPEESSGPLTDGTEYYAFNMLVGRAKSTGAGQCAGCDVPMNITLDRIQVFQLPGLVFDPVLASPLESNVAQWQQCPLPAPTNVAATPQCAAISVSWDAVPGASGYRVKRDGVVISGANPVASSPFVDSSPGASQRCYTVCAVNTIDWGYSDAACATAPAQAPVVSAPAGRTVRAGANVTFSVNATEMPQSYSWRKNSVPIPGAPDQPSITLTNVQTADAGDYDVVVCNLCGCTTSAAATLTVCPDAEPSTPSLIRVSAGTASVDITATAPGGGALQWFRNGDPLSEGAKYTGTTTTTLTIHNVEVSDEAYYGLAATDPCGSTESNACYLSVVTCPDPPTITSQPQDQTAPFGTPASFSVEATSCDVVKYEWDFYNGRYWDAIPGATASTYMIPSVAPADQGNYRCLVYTYGSPAAYTRTATLNLNKPEILSISTRPLSCEAGEVQWTTNVPTTGTVLYGPGCGDLSHSEAGGPLSTTGSAQVTLSGASAAQFKLVVTDVHGQQTTSDCSTVYFNDSATNLSGFAFGSPSYGDLFGTEDGIPVRISVVNYGCTPLVGPVVLTELAINGSVPPRKPDHSVDLPRTLTENGIPGQQAVSISDLMFSRSELGLPTGSRVWVTGKVQYGDAPVHNVYITGKFYLP